MPSRANYPTPGLRERKKARTRAAIQSHALRLFRQHGYQDTTIEQIINAAEVSETTFFRYFPTKEDVVLQDDFDPLIAQILLDQPRELSPIQAIRATFRQHFTQLPPEQHQQMRDRVSLITVEPALRAAMLDQYSQALQLLADAVAERTGRARDDLAVRTIAGAAIGAMMATLATLADNPTADLPTTMDQAFEHLEAGLSL
ncbi:TetR family transcriptional regulator [Micromonospora sp. NPDC048898]|uniref:acyl-CoA-like ligand-binding transcription factor n=1 Tax=Micromonospora sp. NPDC048898 TaxID=3364260 RepID=UPI0037159190